VGPTPVVNEISAQIHSTSFIMTKADTDAIVSETKSCFVSASLTPPNATMNYTVIVAVGIVDV
jgi:hypothetical protein